MAQKIDVVDFIVTDNEVEALILENNLIKKHRPRYNIDFTRLTQEPGINIYSVK